MNKFKRTLLFTVLGAMTFALPGCGEEEKKSVSITLSCDFEGSEIERHQSAQFSFTVENAEASSVAYAISSDVATIAADGKMTVKDDAKVGTEFVVYAKVGDVKSNDISFKVVDTTPTGLRLVPSAKAIKQDNEIHFGATYTPTYATITEYTVAAIGDNASLVEVTDNVLKLKAGVSYVENLEKVVKVRATLNRNPEVYGETELTIGEVVASIDLENINLNVKQESSYTVKPILYDNNQIVVTPSLDFEFESENKNIFEVSKYSGKITPVGHGSGKLKVTYGSKQETATVNIIIPADEIEVQNVSPTALKNGLYFGRGDAYPLAIKNTFNTEKYKRACTNYDFKFTLLNTGAEEDPTGDDVATIDKDNNIHFNTTGKVRLDITTNSSLEGFKYTDEEKTTTFYFNVNDGVNVHDYTEMAAALEDSEIDVINFVKDIEVNGKNVKRVSGVGSASSYDGIVAKGDKYLRGNGYKIDLSTLGPDEYKEKGQGADFIKFVPADAKKNEAFTVQMYDLTLYGSTDYNGYFEKVEDPLEWQDPAKLAKNAYIVTPTQTGMSVEYGKTFRTGFMVGYDNDVDGFIDKKDNKTHQTYHDAYVKDFVMNNVTIRGFYWGLWAQHVIGTTENFTVFDCAQKGVLNTQSQLTMNNTTFGQIGQFACEITNDGINHRTDFNAADHGPTAGPDYDEKPFINLTGSISVDNLNAGADSLEMIIFNEQIKAFTGGKIQTMPQLIQVIFSGIAKALAEENDRDEQALNALWASIIKNEKGQLNMFNLSFMADPENAWYLSGEGKQVADAYSMYKDNGVEIATFKDEEFTELAPTDLTAIMQQYVDSYDEDSGTYSYASYKQYRFISATIDTGDMYLGKVVLPNFTYDPSYVPPVQE